MPKPVAAEKKSYRQVVLGRLCKPVFEVEPIVIPQIVQQIPATSRSPRRRVSSPAETSNGITGDKTNQDFGGQMSGPRPHVLPAMARGSVQEPSDTEREHPEHSQALQVPAGDGHRANSSGQDYRTNPESEQVCISVSETGPIEDGPRGHRTDVQTETQLARTKNGTP